MPSQVMKGEPKSVTVGGGTPRRVSNTYPHRHHYYLHGISPDGKTLSYVGINAVGDNQWAKVNIWTIPAAGGIAYGLWSLVDALGWA